MISILFCMGIAAAAGFIAGWQAKDKHSRGELP